MGQNHFPSFFWSLLTISLFHSGEIYAVSKSLPTLQRSGWRFAFSLVKCIWFGI